MSERARLIFLVCVVTATVALAVAGLTTLILYRTAADQQRARLDGMVQSQARLLEAVARFDAKYSDDDFPGGGHGAEELMARISPVHWQTEVLT